jgi:hypothetical protein
MAVCVFGTGPDTLHGAGQARPALLSKGMVYLRVHAVWQPFAAEPRQ